MSEKKSPVRRPRKTQPPAGPQDIAARAYQLFLARGAEHGRDWDDWLAAERELARLASAAGPGTRAVSVRPASDRRGASR